jgi:hypothetical protein
MRGAALLALATLAGCGSQTQAPPPKASQTTAAAPVLTEAPAPTPAPAPKATVQPARDTAVLDSRDCRTVAQAYADAVARGDFAFAAMVWNDPGIDSARLKTSFARYKKPAIAIASIEQEGAAGSLYCTVTGSLADKNDPAKALQQDEIVLRRVNDVPGATPAQLRWTIRSSTFVENLQRGA